MSEPRSDPIGVVEAALAAVDPKDLADNDQTRRARRVKAMSLRLAGASYEQIADTLQTGISDVAGMITDGLAMAEQRLDVTAMRALENARLDAVQMRIWQQAQTGDLKAAEVLLRYSERRARMNGFDAPARATISIDVQSRVDAALAALEAEILLLPSEAHDEPPRDG